MSKEDTQLQNTLVMHSLWGLGTVVEVTGDYLSVHFMMGKTKSFTISKAVASGEIRLLDARAQAAYAKRQHEPPRFAVTVGTSLSNAELVATLAVSARGAVRQLAGDALVAVAELDDNAALICSAGATACQQVRQAKVVHVFEYTPHHQYIYRGVAKAVGEVQRVLAPTPKQPKRMVSQVTLTI